jgi:hypothetical protein
MPRASLVREQKRANEYGDNLCVVFLSNRFSSSITLFLERGVHRLNHPRPCETPVSAHVLSYDPALEAPLSLPITYLQSDTTTWFYPIRIILDENDMTGSADLHSAILLFNFGCTYLSMGQPRALTNAIRVLDLAVTILERMAEAPVVLEFLCLGAILRASRQSHERLCCDMTKYYLERYQEVMTQVSLLEMDKLFTSDHLSAAAA